MRQLPDFQGRLVRLTDERLAHILGHPEMAGFQSEIELTLRRPQTVIRSRTDPSANLCYRFYAQTPVGGKMALRCGKILSGRCVGADRLLDG